MPDHIAVCEVEYYYVEIAAVEFFENFVGYFVSAHFGFKIVGCNLGGGNQVALFALVGRLYAAVEKEGDVGVFFGFGNAQLLFAELCKILAQSIVKRGFGEGDI